jgi:Flp pilus assembly protein TadG
MKLKHFLKCENGVAGVEFAFIAPLMAVVFLGIMSGWSYYRTVADMRDSVEAGAKYYLQGGSNDATAQSVANGAWENKPNGATVTTTRMCSCAGATVDCTTAICTDQSVPHAQVAIAATVTWKNPLTDIMYQEGVSLSQSEVVRVR